MADTEIPVDGRGRPARHQRPDRIMNSLDNCPNMPNASQQNTDGDGLGGAGGGGCLDAVLLFPRDKKHFHEKRAIRG